MSAPLDTPEAIAAAWQAGRTAEARVALGALLLREPDRVPALALAGLIELEEGDAAGALPLLDRAVALDPAFWPGLLHRAAAREARGDLPGAAADYRAVIARRSEAAFHVGLASVLGRLGDRAGERAALEAALGLDPRCVAALNNLGLRDEEEGRGDAALARFEAAAGAAKDNPDVAQNLERLLFEKGKRIGAGDAEAGIRFFAEQIARHPGFGGLFTGLGNLRLERCEIAGAEEAFRSAVALRPEDADARINHGVALHRLGRPAEALARYEEARLLLDGVETAVLRWNRSLSRLLLGDLERGFADYEARTFDSASPLFRADHPIPLWDGRPLDGERLLLVAEQGYGDAIQLVRYAELAQERGARVTVACDPPLARLLARARGVESVVTPDAIGGGYAWRAPLLSLPGLFGTRLETVPAEVPYLDMPAPGPRASGPLRIALVWSGNPKYLNDRRRSCPLELFAALGALPGTEWTSLQFGPAAAERAAHPWLRDGAEGSKDFYDTALRIQDFDLVISVDTAVAHLAGALGKPVWILLPAAPDWRWLLNRDDSPWYSTARLFRQEIEGDWQHAVNKLAITLRGRLDAARR